MSAQRRQRTEQSFEVNQARWHDNVEFGCLWNSNAQIARQRFTVASLGFVGLAVSLCLLTCSCRNYKSGNLKKRWSERRRLCLRLAEISTHLAPTATLLVVLSFSNGSIKTNNTKCDVGDPRIHFWHLRDPR